MGSNRVLVGGVKEIADHVLENGVVFACFRIGAGEEFEDELKVVGDSQGIERRIVSFILGER
jgi:hypothetical protein